MVIQLNLINFKYKYGKHDCIKLFQKRIKYAWAQEKFTHSQKTVFQKLTPAVKESLTSSVITQGSECPHIHIFTSNPIGV